MTGLVRSTVGLGLVIALTAGVVHTLPAWLAGPGPKGESAWELGARLVYEDRREELLSQVRASVLNRLARRQEIARDVIAGRLSLLEAAVGFRRLNEQCPDFAAAYRRGYPGATAEESLCRQVIYWVFNELEPKAPDRAREVTSRLEAELESHLSRDGTVHLPGG